MSAHGFPFEKRSGQAAPATPRDPDALKLCRMPGCHQSTTKLYCRECWAGIPGTLRATFINEEDPQKKRAAFGEILAWCQRNTSPAIREARR